MVMAVFALGTILFAWATSSFGTYQGGAGVWFVNRGEALKERFVVEYVSFSGSLAPPARNNITVFVRNVGGMDITVKAVYINSTAYSFNVKVLVGQVRPISVVLSPSAGYWDFDCVTRIAVASERGNVVEGYWKAPSD